MFKDSTTGLLILRGFEVSLNIGKEYADGLAAPLNLRFIEQNPNKLDDNGNLKTFANLARQGHKIVWVINKDIPNGFLGRVQDGQWEKSRQRVMQPAGTNQAQGLDQNNNQMVINRGDWVDNVPNIDAGETLDKVVFTEEGPAPWEE